MIVGFQVLLIGLLADVISANRKLLEDLVYRVRSMEFSGQSPGERPTTTSRSPALTQAGKDRWER